MQPTSAACLWTTGWFEYYECDFVFTFMHAKFVLECLSARLPMRKTRMRIHIDNCVKSPVL